MFVWDDFHSRWDIKFLLQKILLYISKRTRNMWCKMMHILIKKHAVSFQYHRKINICGQRQFRYSIAAILNATLNYFARVWCSSFAFTFWLSIILSLIYFIAFRSLFLKVHVSWDGLDKMVIQFRSQIFGLESLQKFDLNSLVQITWISNDLLLFFDCLWIEKSGSISISQSCIGYRIALLFIEVDMDIGQI